MSSEDAKQGMHLGLLLQDLEHGQASMDGNQCEICLVAYSNSVKQYKSIIGLKE
jgi:hypothetical protein